MKGLTLTAEEFEELRAEHRHAKREGDSYSAYRINAIILLASGWTQSSVAQALLLDDETIRSYVNLYRTGGLKKLLGNNHKGSACKLSEAEIMQLCVELDNQIYLTTQMICDYIERTFGIAYTLAGMTDLLHRLKYSYKKPKLKPANPDREGQEIFLQEFEKFMKNKAKNTAVFFMDAVHPTHVTLSGYGWFRKGQEREIKSNSGRSRLNIHGAINAETLETTIIASEESVNTESTIALLSALEFSYPIAAMIYVILDNARYHFSKVVQDWLKQHPRIQLVFLPTYSPELNLIERLWKVFKKKTLYNKFYATFTDFKKACLGFFKNQDQYYEEISSIMGDGLAALIYES